MKATASATRAWYSAVVGWLNALQRTSAAREVPAAAASWLSRSRSLELMLSLISGILGLSNLFLEVWTVRRLSWTGFS